MEYSYKFRVYPTAAQARQIQRTFGCCRFVWNHYLALRKDLYEQDGKTMNYSTCSEDHRCIWNAIQLPFIAVYIEFTAANGHEADIRVCFSANEGQMHWLFDGSRMDKGFGWSLMPQPYRILSE